MEIFVHYPKTHEKQAELEGRMAKLHAAYVAQYIEKMTCPREQKIQLIDAVAKTIVEKNG